MKGQTEEWLAERLLVVDFEVPRVFIDTGYLTRRYSYVCCQQLGTSTST